MIDFFPKFLKGVFIFLIVMVFVSILIDIGNSFLIKSRNEYIARNANIYVSKFAVDSEKLSEFNKSTITEDDVKKVLHSYFEKQYGGFGYNIQGSPSYTSGKYKATFNPDTFSLASGDYVSYGPVTVRAVFKDFGSGQATVAFQMEQKVPFTIRDFLKQLSTVNQTTYATLNDAAGSFGYMTIETERAFTINILDKIN